MSAGKKTRGRPKSKATLERERTEEMFRNRPAHIPLMTKEQNDFWKESLDANKNIEIQILKDHGSPPMPRKIVYEFESATPEFMTPEQIQNTHKAYETTKRNIQNGQMAGGAKLKAKKENRIATIKKNNQDLIIRKNSSARDIAKKILSDWPKRGDGGKKPSERTLRGWLSTK